MDDMFFDFDPPNVGVKYLPQGVCIRQFEGLFAACRFHIFDG
jgi:hypothetical protein